MIVWKPIGAVHDDPGQGSTTKLAWCKGETVGMTTELAKMDRILLEAKRQVRGEHMQELVALRRRMMREGTWNDGCVAWMYDVAKALGCTEPEIAYVCGDVDVLWSWYKDAQP